MAALVWLPGAVDVAAGTGVVRACLEDEARSAPECFREAWADRPPSISDVRVLREMVTTHPVVVDDVAAWAAGAGVVGQAPRALEAEILDLHGQALLRLGRHAAAAERMLAAVRADDGTSRIRWVGSGGLPLWDAALTSGDGRLLRTARALALSRRRREAVEFASRAIRLGARGSEVDELESSLGSQPELTKPAPPLEVPRWRPRLPDVQVELLDGGTYSLGSARGSVMLIDVWASWCAPCLRELPRFQDLVDREGKRGLVGLALNAQETPQTARKAAEALELTVPVGLYPGELDRVLRVRSLPTIVLVDREGRIRARWDGYRPGIEDSIAAATRVLLDGTPEGDEIRVARVREGLGRFRGLWAKNLPGRITDVAVVSLADGPVIAANGRGGLHLIAPMGDPRASPAAPAGVDQLETVVDERGRRSFVGYRRGADHVVAFEPRGEETSRWRAPGEILDVTIRGSAGSSLILATVEGLFAAESNGENVRRLGEPGRFVAVTATGPSRAAALDATGRLHWIGAAEVVGPPDVVGGEGWKLIGDARADGVGVVPAEATAAATGRFFEGDGGPHAAVVTVAGQLVVVGLRDGSTALRADWPGISGVAAGDLDADGADELIVAAGPRLVVLESVPGDEREVRRAGPP